MKTVNRLFGILLGATALFLSCTKQENPVRQEGNTFEMTIVAGTDQTRTVLGRDGTVTWSASGEQLAVIEAATTNSATTTAKETSSNGTTTDGGATMTFGVKMPSKTANSFSYYALYPNSAYVEKPTDLTNVKVNLASTQAPTESSFGPSADVLVAKPVTGLNAQPTELNLQFARVIAVGKMTIKDLNTTENVKKVTFTAAGKPVTGRSYINFTNAAGVEYGYSNQGVDNVVLDYSDKTITANGMTAVFTCWPFTLAANETFSVVVETENYTFTKDVTLAEGKSLAFNVGRASAFKVSFSGIEGVEKEQTWTWTAASEDLGTKTSYSATLNKKAWTVTRSKVVYTGFLSSCIQLGSKSGAETVTLTSNAFTGTVKSVAVECSSYNGAHTVDITVGGTSYASGVSTDSWQTVGTVSGRGTSSGEIVIKFKDGSRALYIKSISITYEGGSDPVKLTTPSVTCSSKTENSLTFSWDEVANASGYQVSTDGGTTYSSIQNATTYTWTGLTASTTKTLYVKAIGDGTNFTDSDAAFASGTTTSGSGSGEESKVYLSEDFASLTAWGTSSKSSFDLTSGTWTASGSVYEQNGCIKIGSRTNAANSITTPALSNISGTADVILTFKAVSSDSGYTMSVVANNAGTVGELSPSSITQNSTAINSGESSATALTEAFAASTATFTVTITGATSSTTLTIQTSDNSKRWYLDDVKVVSAN